MAPGRGALPGLARRAEVRVSGVMSTVCDFEGTQVLAIGSKPAGGLTLDPAGNHYPENRDKWEQKFTKITRTGTGDSEPGNLPGEVMR